MFNFIAAVAIFNAVSVMGWCTYDGKLTTAADQTCTEPGYMTVYETLLTGDNIYCPTTSKTTVSCECTAMPTVSEVTTEVSPMSAEEPCTTDVVTQVVDCKDCHDEEHHGHHECVDGNCEHHYTQTQVGKSTIIYV